jgi:hypothetical protein
MGPEEEPLSMAAAPTRSTLVKLRASKPRTWHGEGRTSGAVLKLAAAAGFVLSGSPGQVFAEDFKKLSNMQIRRLVTGKIFTDDVRYRDRFLPGGKYEGVSMGKSFSGTWEVSGGELCFTRLAGEKPDCNEIWQSQTDAAHVGLRKSWQAEGKSAVVLPK